MTPAEENALIYEALKEISQDGDMGEAIRLAIRAAVAAERERAADACFGCHVETAGINSVDEAIEICRDLFAAAIRRGE